MKKLDASCKCVPLSTLIASLTDANEPLFAYAHLFWGFTVCTDELDASWAAVMRAERAHFVRVRGIYEGTGQFVGLAETCVTIEWSEVATITSDTKVPDGGRARLDAFCDAIGIRRRDGAWLLVAAYG